MKKPAKWGLCALALLAAFGIGRGDRVYTETDLARAREEAYNSGYHAGYSEGLTDEQTALYDEAFAAGRSEGFEAGLAEGIASIDNAAPPAHTYQIAAITPFVPSTTPTDDITESVQQSSEDNQQITVYITNSGTKYHLDGCRHLKSKIEKTLDEVRELKLEPCKVCNPPN